MRQRTRYWTEGLLSAMLGLLLAAPAFAQTALHWGTPQINGANDSSVQAVEPRQSVSLRQNMNEQLINTSTASIQQVRYNRQQIPDRPGPSQDAVLDTQYPPQSRPQFTTPPAQAPTSQRRDPALFGDDNYGIGGTGEEDAADDDEDYSSGLDAPLTQKGVVINCPEGNILKPISDIDYDIRLKPGDMFPKECGLVGDDSPFPSRDWGRICFMWKASALCHKPLYFEEEALERYGHTLVQEEFQPIISGAKFFLTIPILPYKMGLNPPNECIYALGHYRPGSCAPYMIDPLPLSLRAGLIQAGAVVGGVAIFP